MTNEERAIKQAHLQQASVHLVDAIANILAANVSRGDVSELVRPLKVVLGECTAEILYLQRVEPDREVLRRPDR